MSEVQVLSLGVAGLAGAGAWLVLAALGQVCVALLDRVGSYRRSRAAQQLARYQATAPAAALPDHVL